MQDRKAIFIGAAIGCLLVTCLCVLLVLGGGALFAREALIELEEMGGIEFNTDPGPPTPTPELVRPEDDGPTNAAPPEETNENLLTLYHALIPENNPVDLAMRLQGVDNIPTTFTDPNMPYAVGDHSSFWITNTSTNDSLMVWATLRYITDHLYFWIGDDVRYDEGELEHIAETFENQIYPTTRNFFGSEWSPGIDEDPHIYILYVPGIGYGTAGYFSSADEMHPLAHEYSNAHEMFVINADNSPLADNFTYGVLAHEFQHMIHWNLDRNETSWINEGFSELAAFLNGYDPGGFDYYFISEPDYQLNDWPNDDDTGASYGAAFLFVTYFLDRLGEDATQLLAAHPNNGLGSIDLVLQELNIQDPLTGLQLTADELILDWALANYLQDGDVGDGRYVYHNYPNAPQAYETETISSCDSGPYVREVHQYGTDYIRITCSEAYTLHFEGSVQTTLVPESAHSGKFAFWSNKGDESDMTLTRLFDFTEHTGDLTLRYWVWYDIEEDYDYIYLEASTNGEDWDILTTPSGTAEDPSGNSYGWGYNGVSGRWILEEVDLSRFAGQEVYLRFEYVTDASVHGEGLLLDDVSIPEIGYETDFEDDDGGWEGAGFVRVSNILPQTFRLALIYVGNHDTTVEYLTLNEDNTVEIDIDPGNKHSSEVILVVIGTTRFTRQYAAYQIDFLP